MRPRRELVQVVTRQDFVLGPKLEELHGFLVTLALENVEVLDDELILFGPSDSEPSGVSPGVQGPGLSQTCNSAHGGGVEQVEDLLVVDLQK